MSHERNIILFTLLMIGLVVAAAVAVFFIA